MILINVQGLSNGNHIIKVSGKADGKIKSDYIESDVIIEGSLRVHNDRLILKGTAKTDASLICDMSLEDYKEEIEANISIIILKGIKEEYRTETDENTIYISEEEKNANITEIVLQELLVKIPMKKVAPKYVGKAIEDIYPQIKESKKEGQSPFDILKNLKNN